jgi:hypothetical protein
VNREGLDLALGNPLELAQLRLAPDFEEIVLDEVRALLHALDLIDDLLASRLDGAELLLEGVHAAARQVDMLLNGTRGGSPAPEQLGCAERIELFQARAHRVQQLELLPLGGETRDLAVHASQVLEEPIEPLARLVELRAERLFVLCRYVLHGFV